MMPYEKLIGRLIEQGFYITTHLGPYGALFVDDKKDFAKHPLKRDIRIRYNLDPVELTAEMCQAIEQDVLTTFGEK